MAEEDNTQRYFELLREYYADKGGDVDQLIQMIRMGDPLAKDKDGIPLFLQINTQKGGEQLKKELAVVLQAMAEAPSITPEEKALLEAQHDVIVQHVDKVIVERSHNAELEVAASQAEDWKLARQYRSEITQVEQANLNRIVSGLGELWKDAHKHKSEKDGFVPEEVNAVLNSLLTMQAKVHPEAVTRPEKADFLEPISSLSAMDTNNAGDPLYIRAGDPLYIRAIKSNMQADFILPALFKASSDPFACDSRGHPAFTCVNPNKPSAKSELGFIVGQMKKCEGVNAEDKALIAAQSSAILWSWDWAKRAHDEKKAAVDAARASLKECQEAEQPGEGHVKELERREENVKRKEEEFKDNKNLASDVMNGLGKVWSETKRNSTTAVPAELHTLLAPLLSTSEMPTFVGFLSRYNGSTTQDVATEVATHIVLPQTLREYARQTGADLASDAHLEAFNGHTLGMVSQITPLVHSKLFDGRDLREREALSISWHREAFPDPLIPLKAAGSWHCLTTTNAYVIDPAETGQHKVITDFNKNPNNNDILVLPGADSLQMHETSGRGTQLIFHKDGADDNVLTIEKADSEQVAKRLTFASYHEYPQLAGVQTQPRIQILTAGEINRLHAKTDLNEELKVTAIPMRVFDVPPSAISGAEGRKSSGISLVVETSDERLKYLSRPDVMDHCVGRGGNYTSQCLNPTDGHSTHIISVIKEGEVNPLSTIQAVWDGKTLGMPQNFGYQNSDPGQEAKDAAAWLKQQIEGGKIQLSTELGETPESKEINKRPEIIKTIGFEQTAVKRDAAYNEYIRNIKRKARRWHKEERVWDDKFSDHELFRAIEVPVMENGEPVMNDRGHPKTTQVKCTTPEEWQKRKNELQVGTLCKHVASMSEIQRNVLAGSIRTLLGSDDEQLLIPEDLGEKKVYSTIAKTMANKYPDPLNELRKLMGKDYPVDTYNDHNDQAEPKCTTPDEWFEHSGLRAETRHIIKPHIERAHAAGMIAHVEEEAQQAVVNKTFPSTGQIVTSSQSPFVHREMDVDTTVSNRTYPEPDSQLDGQQDTHWQNTVAEKETTVAMHPQAGFRRFIPPSSENSGPRGGSRPWSHRRPSRGNSPQHLHGRDSKESPDNDLMKR